MKSFYKLSALIAISTQALASSNGIWRGTTNSNLNTNTNWNPTVVPSDLAKFDSAIAPSSFSPSAVDIFSIGILEFQNSAEAFTFTFTGPGALEITDAGIIGINTNPRITATNVAAMTSAQIFLNTTAASTSLGSASWNLTNNTAGSLSFQNAAQLILGDSDVLSVSPVTGGDNASFILNNYGIISGVNEASQIFLKGSSYFGGKNILIQATNAGDGASISSNSDTGQIVLDAGHSIAIVNLGDAITCNLNNGGTIESIGHGNNVGQLIIDGSHGNATMGLGNNIIFSFTNKNSSTISTGTNGNDAGQLVLDGNNGNAYFIADNNANMTFENSTNSSITGLGFDTGQLVIDGDGGIAFFELADNATFNFSNGNDCALSGGSDGNDTGQIIIDSNGGTAYMTLGPNANLSFSNDGQISSYHNTGQIVVDATGGRTYLNLGDNSIITLTNNGDITNLNNGYITGQFIINASEGSSIFNTGNDSTITVTNMESGTITGVGENLAQIYFNDVTINGSPTFAVINQSPIPIDGIVFNGGANADNATISLTNSSLVVKVGNEYPLMIAALQGDDRSAVSLYNDLMINMTAGSSSSFAGTISDGAGSNGLIITGSGIQKLSGASTFTGQTSIEGGAKLILTGSLIGDVSVSTGTLSGTGTVEGTVTVAAGATVAPGMSPGTLTVGSLNLNSSSQTLISLNTEEGSSKIVVTDIASLAGTVLVSQEKGDYQRTGHYPIITGSYTGQFNSFTIGGLPGFLFSLAYGPDVVYLDYSLYQIPTDDLSGNARKIARYLNQYAAPSTLALFEGLYGKTLKSALDSVSPSRNAFGNYITQQLAFSLNSMLASHMDLLRTKPASTGSSPTLAALVADASDQIHPSNDHKDPFSLWVSGFGEYAHQKTQSQNPSFNYMSGAALAGLDYQMGEQNFVGGALGYAYTHFTEDHHLGHGHINYYFTNLYGNAFVGHFYFSPAVWGIFNENHNTRNIFFPGFSDKAKANIFAWQLVPHLEVGYQAVFSWGELLPFTAADWAISWQRKYHEKGSSPFNARSASKSNSMVRSETGLKFCEKWDYSWGAFFLREKLSYAFEKPYGTETVQTALTGIPTSFTVTAVNHNLNLLDIGFDFSVAIGKKSPAEISLAYEGEFGSQYWSQQASLIFDVNF